MVRTLRKIIPTLRILGYLRTRTDVRIYAVLGTPNFLSCRNMGSSEKKDAQFYNIFNISFVE